MEASGPLVKTDWLLASLRAGTGALLDFIYPPICLACDAPIAKHGALCAACFARLRPITAPHCPVMGLPFDHDMGADARSAEAIADPPPFERARSALLYTDVVSRLVSRLKYGDQPELAAFCARQMLRAGADLWGDDAVLVPIPMPAGRLFMRRYNQAHEIARQLARLTGLRVDAERLQRKRDRRRQVGLSRAGRRRNVQGAFKAVLPETTRRRAQRIIIVDDVITTGATVRAAARVLRAAGHERIDVISFARVVRGRDEVF